MNIYDYNGYDWVVPSLMLMGRWGLIVSQWSAEPQSVKVVFPVLFHYLICYGQLRCKGMRGLYTYNTKVPTSGYDHTAIVKDLPISFHCKNPVQNKLKAKNLDKKNKNLKYKWLRIVTNHHSRKLLLLACLHTSSLLFIHVGKNLNNSLLPSYNDILGWVFLSILHRLVSKPRCEMTG